MLTTRSVKTAVRCNQPFNWFAAYDVGFDDLIYILGAHMSVPDRVGVDDHVRSMLTLVEAARFVGPDLVLQTALRQLLLKNPLQLTLAARVAATARMSFRTLVDANKDMLLELRHTNTVADFEGSMKLRTGDRELASGCSQIAISHSAAPVSVGEVGSYGYAGALREKKSLLTIIFEAHKFRQCGAHCGQAKINLAMSRKANFFFDSTRIVRQQADREVCTGANERAQCGALVSPPVDCPCHEEGADCEIVDNRMSLGRDGFRRALRLGCFT